MDGAKVGVLEDVDQMMGSEINEQALFHLYNFAKENQFSILMTSRLPPAQWSISLADLKSRMGAVPVVGILNPDDTVMEAILVKLFADRQLHIQRGVITYMLGHMERSFSSAQKLVEKIDKQALAQKRKITVSLVRDLL
jgi:chromosomal replication initiation ATPase DnaA